MPAKGPVSLTRQTIYCFIPFFDLYAFYKIKKLRLYLLIIIGIAVAFTIIEEGINPIPESDDPVLYMDNFGNIDWVKIFFGPNPEISVGIFIANTAVAIIIAIFFIRRWSKKWNESFSI